MRPSVLAKAAPVNQSRVPSCAAAESPPTSGSSSSTEGLGARKHRGHFLVAERGEVGVISADGSERIAHDQAHESVSFLPEPHRGLLRGTRDGDGDLAPAVATSIVDRGAHREPRGQPVVDEDHVRPGKALSEPVRFIQLDAAPDLGLGARAAADAMTSGPSSSWGDDLALEDDLTVLVQCAERQLRRGRRRQLARVDDRQRPAEALDDRQSDRDAAAGWR